MDQQDNEIHHIQFFDSNGELPTSMTILVRHKKGQIKKNKRPINSDDLLLIHRELKGKKSLKKILNHGKSKKRKS